MKLYSYHRTNFDLTKGSIDPTKGDWWNCPSTPNYQMVRCELAKKIGTDQFVWCTRPDAGEDEQQWLSRKRRNWHPRGEWVLEIDETKDLLEIIDSHVWNILIGSYTNNNIEPHLRREAKRLGFMYDDENDYVNQRMKRYESEPTHPDGWWSQLFLDDPHAQGIDILLRYPVDLKWIIAAPLLGNRPSNP